MASIKLAKHISFKTFIAFVLIMAFFFIQTIMTINFQDPNYTMIIIKMCIYMGIGTVVSLMTGNLNNMVEIIKILHNPDLTFEQKFQQIEQMAIGSMESQIFGKVSSSSSSSNKSTPPDTNTQPTTTEVSGSSPQPTG